jgi:integrase
MSAFDQKSTALSATGKLVVNENQPILLFKDVLHAVNSATNIKVGVQQNLRTAVTRTAYLMSPLGLDGPVSIPDITTKLGKLAPAQLGFKCDSSKAAYMSNLRRALRLAGVTVMPGRHVTVLSPEWQALFSQATDMPTRIGLSRFVHVASEEGWQPKEIGQKHLDRFRHLLGETCMGSKCAKVVRNTVRAWTGAQKAIPDWPTGKLVHSQRGDHGYSLNWSDFPASFRADVDAFVSRDDLDDLDDDTRPLRPLRPRTVENYRNTCLRAASILVRVGTPAESIEALKDLVALPKVRRICEFLAQRNQRREGGAVFQTAFILYIAAKHHVRLPEEDLRRHMAFCRRIRGPYGEMSSRTFKRLQQFDDPEATAAMARLPTVLFAAARKLSEPSISSAKLVRTALLISLAQDTGLRAGNLVAIDVNRHLSLRHPRRRGPVIADLVIPKSEVKNSVEIQTRLTDHTARLLEVWLEHYRRTQFAVNCNSGWLFPSNGRLGHLSVSQFLADVKDLAARHAGLDVTPHLIRSFIGKVILDEQPDGHAIVQQVLGHKRLETTVRFYAPVRPAKARSRYHESLDRLRGGR